MNDWEGDYSVNPSSSYNIFGAPFHVVHSGYIFADQLNAQGKGALFRTSLAYTESSAYALNTRPDSIFPAGRWDKNQSYSLRNHKQLHRKAKNKNSKVYFKVFRNTNRGETIPNLKVHFKIWKSRAILWLNS